MRKNNINPHCHVCMEEFKMGVDVVMDGTFKGIIHADCNYLRQVRLRIEGNLRMSSRGTKGGLTNLIMF